MDTSRAKILANEIDLMNAIINNDKEDISIQKLFENMNDLSIEQKLDRLCEIAYKLLNSVDLEYPSLLISLFDELYPDAGVGEFCVEFLRYQIYDRNLGINEKIEKLESFNYSRVPDSEIKMNYLNQLLSLLLNQEFMDFNKINKYNKVLKDLIKNNEN